MASPTAATVFNYIAFFLWSFQLAPQVYENYKSKSTGTLSPYMVLLWAVWAPVYASHALWSGVELPVVIQPNVFGFLSGICWTQCTFYNPSRLRKKLGFPEDNKCQAVAMFVALTSILAAIEVGLFYALKASSAGLSTALPILATALITSGFIPQYMFLVRTRDPSGISIPFLLMDMSGGVFSMLGLLLAVDNGDEEAWIRRLSCGSYAAVAALDAGLISLIIWLRPKHDSHVSDVDILPVHKDVVVVGDPLVAT
ncbi:hypothetical protein HDU85_004374 [Gaertneriomyces sp. JEL0708]|nr:hypothetical protein HDU85_004374 [Gaertneriomyces sp. JEL0708]